MPLLNSFDPCFEDCYNNWGRVGFCEHNGYTVAKRDCGRIGSAREGCSVRKINMTISLAFLAPDLVKAAIEGRLPHGMGVTRASATCPPNGPASIACST